MRLFKPNLDATSDSLIILLDEMVEDKFFVLVYQKIELSLILFNFCSKTFKVNHVWSMESRSVSASPIF